MQNKWNNTAVINQAHSNKWNGECLIVRQKLLQQFSQTDQYKLQIC